MPPQHAAPWWLPGGHLQTIWPALVAPPAARTALPYRRERWATPDADFIDVDVVDAAQADAPRLVLFHGLEGSSDAGYARAFGALARAAGWSFVVPHFRGCSGELNLAPRAYHSGDFAEIGWILERLSTGERGRGGPVFALGISLGGNALLRWAEEAGHAAARHAHAVSAVCSPIDLAAGGHAIGRGFSRLVYTRNFLQTMKPKALAKLAQHPGLFDGRALMAARSLYEFDNVFTAPLHGFRNTEDYWARASAKPRLADIRIPALVLNALNDPFVPAACLPRQAEVGAHVTLWQPAGGGHVGLARGRQRGQRDDVTAQVFGWLQGHGPQGARHG